MMGGWLRTQALPNNEGKDYPNEPRLLSLRKDNLITAAVSGHVMQ